MERLKVIKFIEAKREFLFPNKKYSEEILENKLLAAPDSFEKTMNSIPYRKPKTLKILAIFLGPIGVDRFYLGDIVKGIIKYFTFGGLGIWWIADIISAKDRCRGYNCKKLTDAINDPAVIAQMQNVDNKISSAYDKAKRYGPAVKTAVKGLKDVRDSLGDFR